MPRREDINSVLVIGSGPIVIGQACEFDYSGTQACRVLKAEGIRVILVNSNPATIMTDPEVADATYVEPITPAYVERIIERERPDALLATLGGQTALNTAMALHRAGATAGREALARFERAKDEPFDVRWALLEAAAYNAPAETQPTLERLILVYEGKGEELRTQAVRIAAETIPERAIELYEPMLRDPLARQTRPPQEELVRGWATAAKKLGLKDARVLCDLVVDLRQPPDARYAAVNALADIGGERAIRALREVLVESARISALSPRTTALSQRCA